MSDHAELMEKIAKGDKNAFGELYRQLEKPVFRFLRSKLNDPFEANDILHDVFIEVWRSAAKFEGRSKVQTWVFGIAFRKAIDAMRKSGRVQLTDEIPEKADDSVNTEACVLASQEAEHVRFCVDQLSADHRDVVNLAFFDDLNYGEISGILGTPEGTVKSRIYHAKQALLRCLSARLGASTT